MNQDEAACGPNMVLGTPGVIHMHGKGEEVGMGLQNNDDMAQ